MNQTLLYSILALANDKAAMYDAAAMDVARATVATILHGDASLFVRTLEALDSRKGATAKAVAERLRAAGLAAKQLREDLYPNGRKGKATDKETAAAEEAAGPVADAFREGCKADASARSEKAVQAQATAKAKREASAPTPAPTPVPLSEADVGDVVAAIMARGPEFATAVAAGLAMAMAQATAATSEAIATAATPVADVPTPAKGRSSRKAAEVAPV